MADAKVKERPILMSAPMVRATWREPDPKTQTRRTTGLDFINEAPDEWAFNRMMIEEVGDNALAVFSKGGRIVPVKCPYGLVGHRLWVKENYTLESFWQLMGVDDYAVEILYAADGARGTAYQCDAAEHVGFWPGAAIRKYEGKLRPNIFMYRWASRMTLDITDLRVERLQNISEEDSKAEGVFFDGTYWLGGVHPVKGSPQCWPTAKRAYQALWDSINGAGAWDKNPWVWCVSFRRLEVV